ncbi:MAG: type II toxin-antitoxin system RelE/ParE family toxin [Bacteroidota bacterium]
MGSSKEKAPETYSLRITDNALKNVDEITGYIAYIKHQPLNAIKVGDKIFETIERIEKNPSAFKECEEIPTKNKIISLFLQELLLSPPLNDKIIIE